MMSKKDFDRIAAGFKWVADDPTSDRATVEKMVHEFCNAAKASNERFDRARFRRASGLENHL